MNKRIFRLLRLKMSSNVNETQQKFFLRGFLAEVFEIKKNRSVPSGTKRF